MNGAGIIEGGAMVDIPADNLRRQLKVNVVGPVALTRGVARKMVKRGRDKVVFVSSVVGIITGPFVGAYSASKFALEAIAQTMAAGLQEFGVEVATADAPQAQRRSRDHGAQNYVPGRTCHRRGTRRSSRPAVG